jgi:iron complex outermembrane recepter protein
MSRKTVSGSITVRSIKTPIASAIKQHRLIQHGSALALSTVLASGSVYAQQLEEVVVTARKKAESLQDAPLSIQAFNTQSIEQLGISNFDDYALLLPSLSIQSIQPGLSTIYMRGAADGGDGNVSGNAPSVALYIDEQPATAIGRNLDIHIYDIERIEALAGPQGTLFGASAQAGTVRIITNKPNPGAFEAGFDVGYSDTKEGDDSYSVEGFVNQPIGDNAAIRLVGWTKEDGGYIDNIPASRNYGLTDEFANLQVPATIEDNSKFVEEDFNTLENTGARLALKVDLNENWSVLASALTQEMETEGVWSHDEENPNGEIGELEVQRFNEDSMNDEFTQFALTVEGDLGFASLTYAASVMDREIEYFNDYADYMVDVPGYVAYICGYYSYYYGGPITAECTSGNIFYQEDNEFERTTHEIRLQSQGSSPLQYTVGFYYEDASHEYLQEWIAPGMAQGGGMDLLGGNRWYVTDQKREQEETAVFGEISYDFTDKLTVLLGARYFENEDAIKGITAYGIEAFDSYGFGLIDVDVKAKDEDSIFKVNVAYALDDDKNIYFTWSEGYRAGGVNRASSATVDPTYAPDFLTNWEFGWKTDWLDQSLRWNGAAYFMEWEDMQFTKFSTAAFQQPIGLTINIGEAEITGFETDLTYMPIEGLTLTAAFGYNEAELSEDFVLIPTDPSSSKSLNAPKGTPLPYAPELKYNLSGRYDFEMGGFDAYAQMVYAYVDESYNDLFVFNGETPNSDRQIQDSYDNVNVSAGIARGNWRVELYANNLTDERAEISRDTQAYGTYVTTNRPRTIGMSLSMRFE